MSAGTPTSAAAAGSSPVSGLSPSPMIGRLPTHPSSAAAGNEDDELELLELQLLATKPPTPAAVSLSSWSALYGGQRGATFPRNRRIQKSLMTLWHERGLLDEVQSEQTRRMLSTIGHWEFNAFAFDRLTNGHNLANLCTHLFEGNGLLAHYRLDPIVVWKFFFLVEQGYHSSNPYHNAVHAADVTQAIHCFLQEDAIRRHLTPMEMMAALVAAVCHDLDHPGKSEKFLIATGNPLACMYSNSSVLENHHWRSAVAALWESGMMHALDEESGERRRFQELVREVILATDISRQGEFLARLRLYLDGELEMDLSAAEPRHFVLQIAMKCADISNPCRSWNISRLWSHRASEEFFRQGDRERELGLPVTPICDRFAMTVAKVQLGFYRGVAAPLFEDWHRFLGSPLSTMMMHNFISNQARWDLIVQQETRNVMAESGASTSSSHTTASSESRRDSVDAPSSTLSGRNGEDGSPDCGGCDGCGGDGACRHQRLSSGDGDDDSSSDACSSYPYLPLDHFLEEPNRSPVPQRVEQPVAAVAAAARLAIRRHSLPLSETRTSKLLASRTSSEDSTDEPGAAECAAVTPSLHRQHSLIRYNVLRHQQSDPVPVLAASNYSRLQTGNSYKRRMLTKTASEDRTMREDDGLRPHAFRMVVSPAPDGTDNLEEEEDLDDDDCENDKENVLLEPPGVSSSRLRCGRRGSAPSTLFWGARHSLSSLQSPANKSPTSPTSRELSPTFLKPCNSDLGPNMSSASPVLVQRLSQIYARGHHGGRRGSLPADAAADLTGQPRSSSCGRSPETQTSGRLSEQGRSHATSNKRPRGGGPRMLRRQSGGSELLRSCITSSSSSPHQLNDGGGGGNQYLSTTKARRGTLRRHHSHGQPHAAVGRRSSVPAESGFGGGLFIEDMLIDSLMLEEQLKASRGAPSQSAELFKTHMLRSLAASGGGGTLKEQSPLALLNSRRGSLPADFCLTRPPGAQQPTPVSPMIK